MKLDVAPQRMELYMKYGHVRIYSFFSAILLCFFSIQPNTRTIPCRTKSTGNAAKEELVRKKLPKRDMSSEDKQQQKSKPLFLNKYVFGTRGGGIFFGARAHARSSTGEYALSYMHPASQDLVSLIAPKARLTTFFAVADKEKKFARYIDELTDNPLLGKDIAHLALVEATGDTVGDSERPAVVLQDNKSTIYLVNSSSYTHHILAARARGVEGFATRDFQSEGRKIQEYLPQDIDALAASQDRVFYALHPSRSSFGDPGTGVGTAILGFSDPKEDENKEKSALVSSGKNAFFESRHCAQSLDRSSPLVSMGSPVRAMRITDMTWDAALKRLFIALDITAGQEGDAHAIVVGRVEKNGHPDGGQRFHLSPFIATSDLGEHQLPVSTTRKGGRVCVYAVKPLRASSSLNYLVGIGGNVEIAPDGSSNEQLLRRTVWALPLAAGGKKEEQWGTLAAKHATSKDCCDAHLAFMFRFHAEQATRNDQLVSPQEKETQVGDGPLIAGVIENLMVRGETVFATVTHADEGQEPGIFYSRPLLDARGHIKGWTRWARARTSINESGTIDPVSGVHLDVVNGHMISLVPQITTLSGDALMSQDNQGDVQTIRCTQWDAGDACMSGNLIRHVNNFFVRGDTAEQEEQEKNGVFNIINLSYRTPGLNGTSIQVFAGKRGLVIAQVGYQKNGMLTPFYGTDFAQCARFDSGIVDRYPESKIVAFGGKSLTATGPIITAAFAQGDSDSWLFAGGNKGLSVLVDEQGSGCGPDGIGTNFSGIRPGMRFVKVGTYRFVYKVIASGSFLYILADNVFDRIDMRTWHLRDTKSITRLCDGRMIGNSIMFDCLVSGKLALLGTSNGLWRTGDGRDIERARNGTEVGWTHLALPGSSLPAIQIVPVTKTGYECDLTCYEGGFIYVLSSCPNKNNASVNRFSIAPADESCAISAQTVLPFDDFFTVGKRSYFVSFGQARHRIASDGVLFFGIHNRTQKTNTRITLADPLREPCLGNRFVGALSKPLEAGIDNRSYISTITRNEATGNWLLAGQQGVRVCE